MSWLYVQEPSSSRGGRPTPGAAWERRWDREALLRQTRRTWAEQPHVPVESPRQRHHRDGGEVWESGWYNGAATWGRGLPLPHQTHDEGGTHWRIFCVASGLRVRRGVFSRNTLTLFILQLLVQERLPLPWHGHCVHCHWQVWHREWMSQGIGMGRENIITTGMDN